MPDQVDPKYPASQPQWWDQYDKAQMDLNAPGSTWRKAFAAILKADRAGEFQYLRHFRNGTEAIYKDSRAWRWALWDLHCKPIFEQPKKQWPDYATAVYDAVPSDWDKGMGRERGIPESWLQQKDWQRVWAFKVTVVLIAGLLERGISAAPHDMMLLVESFMEERVRPEMRAVLAELKQPLAQFESREGGAEPSPGPRTSSRRGRSTKRS